MFKNLIAMAAVLSAAAICLTPGDAIGGSAAAGSNCHAYNYHLAAPPDYQRQAGYLNHGIYDDTLDYPLGATCLLPTENTLGTTVTFRARVNDGNPHFGVTCVGVVYNQNGDAIVSTSNMTTTAAQTGLVTLSATATVSPQSSSYTYGVNCTLPSGVATTLLSARVY